MEVKMPKRGRPRGSTGTGCVGKSEAEAKRSKICGSSDEDQLAGSSSVIQCKSSVNSQQPGSVASQSKKKVPNNAAVRSTPDCLEVAPSGIPGAGFGVWTRQPIAKGTMFGPYEGVKIHSEVDARRSGYAWEIYKDDKLSHYIDGQSLKKANWMRYVNSASSESEQNVYPVQYIGKIYYRARIDLPVNTELLTWYGEHYAEEMGLLTEPPKSSGKRLNFGEGSSKSGVLAE